MRSATLSAVTPIEGGAASSFATVEGYEEKPENRRRLWQNWVAPRYFETLGTPLVAGRDFQFADMGGPRVAIVNQAMVRFYFGDASPLGRHLTFERDTLPYEIVGVVGDAKYEDSHQAPPRTVYLNAFQDGRIQSHFALRTDVNPTGVAPQVRRAVEEVLKTVPVGKVTTLTEQLDSSLVLERVVAMLSGSFGALGACLAAIGLYGLLAYTVTWRTNEIGVRLAPGATAGHVSPMVLKGFGLVSRAGHWRSARPCEPAFRGNAGAGTAGQERAPNRCCERDDDWDRFRGRLYSGPPRRARRSAPGASVRLRKSRGMQ